MNNVVAVTVTYNDVNYLVQSLTALNIQTYPVNRILVVDNNSTDENKQILRDYIKGNDKIIVLWLDDNLGGAGGFEKGVMWAKENYDPDWYWLMDADAYPRPDCLEKLLLHANESDHIGYLAPLIWGYDLEKFQLYHHKKVAKFLERDIPLYKNLNEIPDVSPIVADAFVGPLISKEAVNKVGFPDGEYFIYGDDLEYTYRITREFDAFLIKDAVINHRDQPASNGVQQPRNWWKDYYMYRNRLLFINKYKKSNLTGATGFFLTGLRCAKQIVICFFQKQNGGLKKTRIRMIKKAWHDGILGKKGKTIDPRAFVKKIIG